MASLKMGTVFDPETKRIEYDANQEAEDRKLELTPTEKTCKMMLEIMNSAEHDLSFTTEHSGMFPDNRLPTLDTSLWLESGTDGATTVKYAFFRKPTATPFVIIEQAALSWDSK